jgi:hypothetical protein
MTWFITAPTKEATTKIIQQYALGVPPALAIRELVVNGIEACLRNKEEPGGEVLVTRDHKDINKLSVQNFKGDYLSEDVFKEHLASMCQSGNIVNGKSSFLDVNKGIGAKVAILPKNRDGIVYRSIMKDEQVGIQAQMREDDNGLFCCPTQYCEIQEIETEWPACVEFSSVAYDIDSMKAKTSITEAIIMGDTLEQDTFAFYDDACATKSKKNPDEATGYGILRYLTQRFWDEPGDGKVKVRVKRYSKNPKDKVNDTNIVHGMKRFMKDEQKQHGQFIISYDEQFDVTAHWCIIPKEGEKGRNTNYAHRGFTALAYKGEMYHDHKKHHMTCKKEINECGVIWNHSHFLVVFEIPRTVENIQVDAGRTKLIYDDREIDQSLLRDAFRENLPEEVIQWLEDHQVKDYDPDKFDTILDKAVKDLGFSKVTTSKPETDKWYTSTPTYLIGKLKKFGIAQRFMNSPAKQLKSYQRPKFVMIEEEQAPLCEFHFKSYTMVVNKASELYKFRKAKILDMLDEVCVVQDQLELQLNMYIYIQATHRVFESQSLSSLKTPQELSEEWTPSSLQCWNQHFDENIVKVVRKAQKNQAVLKNKIA